jgi:hypothetical protein
VVPLAGGLALLLAPAVLGHGGSARLLLEPARSNPGGTVVVEGDDLSADDQITLAIEGNGQRIEVGRVASDGQGHLTQAFVVPDQLVSGTYQLEAIGSAGDVIAASLVISGAALPSNGPDQGRGGDDPLLVPLPSNWHSGLSGRGPGTPNPVDPPAADGLPPGAIAAAVAAVLLLALITVNVAARRRPPR